ncbi:MAG: hypothetical protein OD918_04180 [Gammaproteobacteria bacterium]
MMPRIVTAAVTARIVTAAVTARIVTAAVTAAADAKLPESRLCSGGHPEMDLFIHTSGEQVRELQA